MSEPCWKNSAAQALQSLSKPDRGARVAIVGIGHEMRGDDAAGVMVARALNVIASREAAKQPPAAREIASAQTVRLATTHSGPLIVDAGPSPEAFTGPLRPFAPDLVLLIDAAQMNEPIGTVRWLDWRDTSGFSASTHTLPLHVLAEFLFNELECEVALIGIQPGDTSIGAPLSSGVQQAVEEVSEGLHAIVLHDPTIA